jgi:hypothetical protein
VVGQTTHSKGWQVKNPKGSAQYLKKLLLHNPPNVQPRQKATMSRHLTMQLSRKMIFNPTIQAYSPFQILSFTTSKHL